MEHFKSVCNLGFRTGGLLDDNKEISATLFRDMVQQLEEKCPFIIEILETLLCFSEKDRNKNKTHTMKMKCASHALSSLVALANQKFPNDLQLFFGLLCISYGSGKQFINMLSSIGLSLHWDSLMKYLDQRLVGFQTIIDSKFSQSFPVILLMDNINMYRGRKRHYRLFKDVGPKMWNFTGLGAIVPRMDGIEHLLQCPETTNKPQIDFQTLSADHILLESMPEHKTLWEKFLNFYFSNLIKLSLNHIPSSSKPFKEMNETEFNRWLNTIDFTEFDKSSVPKPYRIIDVPRSEVFTLRSKVKQSDTLILPLSIENNATLPGTASILEDLAKQFGIPCIHKAEVLDFDEAKKTFDLVGARCHFEFMKVLHHHRDEMAQLEVEIREAEKAIDGMIDTESDDETSESDENGNDESSESHALKINFQKQDGLFKKVYDKLTKMVWDANHSPDPATAIDELIVKLANDRNWWEAKMDHLNRTVFHHAVENENTSLVRVLLAVGINPNVKEGCGVTPLALAVLKQRNDICRLLVDNHAAFNGLFFTAIPSPYQMAELMGLNDIISTFDNALASRNVVRSLILDLASDVDQPKHHELHATKQSEGDFDFILQRSGKHTFPTAVVGDQGTCKNNRSVKQKDQSAFGWVAEVPGDLHAKGHLCEAVFKAQEKGGFYHLISNVMKRKKLTPEAFRGKKFQEQNLAHIKEAVRDGAIAYGLAAVQTYQHSKYFPSKEQLRQCLQRNGNHNAVLLEGFWTFLQSCSDDSNFAYHSELFTLFGPLLELFNDATKFGQGVARETVWTIMLPVFAQLQFRNYWTEALVHVVHFSAVWPLAFREMLRLNCTVNVSGKDGHGIDLDEFVETYIVQPLKQYASGHSTVQTCRRIMANIQLLQNVRSMYSNKDAFDVHPTKKHHEQSPFPDQLKEMWFCLREGFFDYSQGRTEIFECPKQPDSTQPKYVPKSCVSVYQKGLKKVKDNFNRKLHECFPAMRKYTFSTVETEQENE